MAWFDKKGAENDVVVSTRIRFARNIADYPFYSRLDKTSAGEINDKVKTAAGSGYTVIDVASLSSEEANSLAEKHFISPEFVSNPLPHTLVMNEDKNVYIMVCEEDHIRLQCIKSGLALREAYADACEADDVLGEKLNIAFDDRLGYLTHCPTNLSTGMRASVMMFLPALTMTKNMGQLIRSLPKVGFTIRGMYGEGSEADGYLYQISNSTTLGISEEEIIAKLEDIVGKLIKEERRLRSVIKSDSYDSVGNMASRALGTLKYAYMISSEEFLSLYSSVRLGISLGIIKDMTYEALDSLMINVMPATLTTRAGHIMNASDRDKYRAQYIKEVI